MLNKIIYFLQCVFLIIAAILIICEKYEMSICAGIISIGLSIVFYQNKNKHNNKLIK
jgi:hypothetical protein